jgi:hypothetical protein
MSTTAERKDGEQEDGHHGPHEFQIQIDRVHYTVTKHEMTGAEFEVVPGAPDRKIADKDVVEIRNGKRFFTAPAQINPGSVENSNPRGLR